MNMNLRLLRVGLLLFLALLPFTAMAATPASSGIEGVILLSPSHPGPVRKDEPEARAASNVTFEIGRASCRERV